MSTTQLAELTWNAAYPDRRPWNKLDEATRDEWVRVFSIYEQFLGEAVTSPSKKAV